MVEFHFVYLIVNSPLEILGFVQRASQFNLVKENQLDAQLILSTFRQLLYVSCIYASHQEVQPYVYNN